MEWYKNTFSRVSSHPGVKPDWVSYIAGRFLTIWTSREALHRAGATLQNMSEPITFLLQTHWEPLPHSEQIPKSSPGSVSVSRVTSSLLPPWLTPSQLLCWDAVSGTHQAGCSLTSFTHSFCLGVLPGCLGLASWLLTDATSSGRPPWLMCPSQHSSPSVPSLCFICLHNIYTLSHYFIYL